MFGAGVAIDSRIASTTILRAVAAMFTEDLPVSLRRASITATLTVASKSGAWVGSWDMGLPQDADNVIKIIGKTTAMESLIIGVIRIGY